MTDASPNRPRPKGTVPDHDSGRRLKVAIRVFREILIPMRPNHGGELADDGLYDPFAARAFRPPATQSVRRTRRLSTGFAVRPPRPLRPPGSRSVRQGCAPSAGCAVHWPASSRRTFATNVSWWQKGVCSRRDPSRRVELTTTIAVRVPHAQRRQTLAAPTSRIRMRVSTVRAGQASDRGGTVDSKETGSHRQRGNRWDREKVRRRRRLAENFLSLGGNHPVPRDVRNESPPAATSCGGSRPLSKKTKGKPLVPSFEGCTPWFRVAASDRLGNVPR